jgi:hypothetical protein
LLLTTRSSCPMAGKKDPRDDRPNRSIGVRGCNAGLGVERWNNLLRVPSNMCRSPPVHAGGFFLCIAEIATLRLVRPSVTIRSHVTLLF